MKHEKLNPTQRLMRETRRVQKLNNHPHLSSPHIGEGKKKSSPKFSDEDKPDSDFPYFTLFGIILLAYLIGKNVWGSGFNIKAVGLAVVLVLLCLSTRIRKAIKVVLSLMYGFVGYRLAWQPGDSFLSWQPWAFAIFMFAVAAFLFWGGELLIKDKANDMGESE